MGVETPEEKRKSPPQEQKDVSSYESGSRYRRNRNRSRKSRNRGNDASIIEKSEFKGACKDLEGYYFQSGPSQANDYKKTKDQIVTYTGTKYSAEVSRSIDEMSQFTWVPPVAPIITDFDILETDGVTVKKPATKVPQAYTDRYNIKMKTMVKREDKYEDDMRLSYTLIMGQCNDEMKHELKTQREYELIRNTFDVIALLKLLQQISYNYKAQDFALMSIAKAQEKLYSTKQATSESNIDYLKSFKNRATVVEAVGGSVVNDGIKEYMSEHLFKKSYLVCTSAEQDRCDEQGLEAMLATIYLMNSDSNRYIKLRTDLHDDHLKGYDCYPHDLIDAQRLLLNYSNDDKKKIIQENRNEGQSDLAFAQSGGYNGGGFSGSRFGTRPGDCRKCGEAGHHGFECPKTKEELEAIASKRNSSTDATQAPSTSGQTPTIKGQLNFTNGSVVENEDEYESDYEIMFCQVGTTRVKENSKIIVDYEKICNKAFSQTNENRVKKCDISPWWVLLDNCSTVDIFCNRRLLTDIRQVNATVEVHCNGGVTTTDWMGKLPGYDKLVWLDEGGKCNILSQARVEEEYRVIYDSDNGKGFIATHRKRGTSRHFYQSRKGLHYSDFRQQPVIDNVFAMTTTVKKQKEQFSSRDVKRATIARKLQNSTGNMSLKDYLHAVENNKIKNCPVTPSDIKLAEIIYGPSLPCLRGKTTRSAPNQFRIETTPLPISVHEKYKDVTIAADIMFVRGVRFFVTVSEHIKFGTGENIENAKITTLADAITRVCNVYRTRGFRVNIALMDGQFEPLKGHMPKGVMLNMVSAEEHAGLIERYIRVFKERVRCIICVLPFTHFPFVMVKEIVSGAIFWLNVFNPQGGGISTTMSPRTIVLGSQIDYKAHCQVECGQYVETHDPHDNSMIPRSSPALFLRPNGNAQGGAFFMSLRTGKRLNRQEWTVLPMPDYVPDRVKHLAKTKIEGLPILNRRRESIENADDEDINNSAGVKVGPRIEDDEVTDNESDDNSTHTTDDEDDDNSMPELGEWEGDDDSDDEDDDDEDSDVDEQSTGVDEQSTGVTDDQSAGVEDEQIEVTTKGVPQRNTTTRTRRKVKQTHFDSDFVYTNYSSSLTFSQSHITRNREHVHAINALIKYGELTSPTGKEVVNGMLLSQQYHINKGLKVFGDRGREAVRSEMEQLDELEVVKPRNWSELSQDDKRNALPYLMFLTEKRDDSVKARGCADGSKQEMDKSDISAPVVSTDALFITLVIDAEEGRDVATVDIPGAFLQTKAKPGVILKFTGAMVDILCQVNPKLYEPYVTVEKGKKVLYAEAAKAIYGMVDSAYLFWLYLSSYLSEHGFEMNPYDVCCMNKVINGKQCTIVWHVDDLKISHADAKVVTEVITILEKEFAKHKPLTVRRGDLHDYLGMTIDFSLKGKVMITMIDFIEKMLEEVPEDMNGNKQTPAREHLFKVNDEDPEKLDEQNRMIVHRHTAKLLFLSQRARPDVQTATSFLCTRVKEADADDYKKLARVMQYLRETKYLPLILGTDGSGNIYWYKDGAHAVHRDMRGHTGLMMTFGTGAVYAASLKQKLNTRSSTETELVAFDDGMPQNIWTKYFTKHQGRFLKDNIAYQDNTSTVRLETNGKASSGKMTKHINIRYFFCTDRIKKGELSVQYCPTLDMMADYFTKALQGSLFRKLRDLILGIKPADFEKYKRRYEEVSLWRKQQSELKEREKNSKS